MRIVFWGTYDIGKPRNRILLQGLRENGVDVIECHANVWQGVEDKSQVGGLYRRVGFALRWLFAYPRLVWNYMRLPPHDVVLVGYLGQLDVLILRPFCWCRRVPLVWDTLMSLYDTVVADRRIVRPGGPLAMLLFLWDWLAAWVADVMLVDTEAHRRYFAEHYRIDAERFKRIFVGAEPQMFFPTNRGKSKRSAEGIYRVLFYGQFIPLHGMETIAYAARLTAGEGIHWDIIGDGQDSERFRSVLRQERIEELTWTPWVPYPELIEHIHAADVCLGIFGTSDKASRVIPNKIFQIVAGGPGMFKSSGG